MLEIHTYPVPKGMDWAEAFAELQTFGYFPEYRWYKPRFWRMHWVNARYDPVTHVLERI